MTYESPLVGRVIDRIELWYRCDAEAARGWASSRLPSGLAARTRGPWAYWRVEAVRLEGVRPAGAPASAALGFAAVSYGLAVSAMTRAIDVMHGLWVPRLDVSAGAVAPLAGSLVGGVAAPSPARVGWQSDEPVTGFRVSDTRRGRGEARVDVADGGRDTLRPGSSFPSRLDREAWLSIGRRWMTSTGDAARPWLRQVMVEDRPDAPGASVAVDRAEFAWFEAVGLAGRLSLEQGRRWAGGERLWRAEAAAALLTDRPAAAVDRAARAVRAEVA